jgi:hypothetical protein
MQDLLEEAETAIRIAAAQVSRRYRGYLTFADLMQEGNIWVLKHPGTTRSRLEDGRRGSRRLVGQLAKHFDRLGRNEKAFSLQYSPDDEAFYTTALVEACLPAIWDESLMDQPPVSDMLDNRRANTDPSEAGNWTVSTIDVRKAWTSAVMDDNVRLALAYRYGEGLRNWQVAELLQVSDSTVTVWLRKGINALVRELGGFAPGRCDGECECGEGIGSRRVMSNAEARARTADQYE